MEEGGEGRPPETNPAAMAVPPCYAMLPTQKYTSRMTNTDETKNTISDISSLSLLIRPPPGMWLVLINNTSFRFNKIYDF